MQHSLLAPNWTVIPPSFWISVLEYHTSVSNLLTKGYKSNARAAQETIKQARVCLYTSHLFICKSWQPCVTQKGKSKVIWMLSIGILFLISWYSYYFSSLLISSSVLIFRKMSLMLLNLGDCLFLAENFSYNPGICIAYDISFWL